MASIPDAEDSSSRYLYRDQQAEKVERAKETQMMDRLADKLNRSALLIGAGALAMVGLLIAMVGPAASQAQVTTEYFSPDSSGFERFIDVKKEGPSNGDYFLLGHALQNPEDGTRVGRMFGICTIIKIDPQHANTIQTCEIQLNLADGGVMTEGTFSVALLDEGATIAVTGGTGNYSQAAGTLTLTGTEVDGESGVLLSLDLL